MSQRIAVIGSGFAGMWSALAAARRLDQAGRADVEILVIAPEPALHIRPRLYEENPAALSAPLTKIFATAGVRFVQGTVETIDVVNKRLEVLAAGDGGDVGDLGDAAQAGGRVTLAYDKLVLAAGSRLFQPELPGLREHAHNVDQIADAVRLEEHLARLPRRADSRARNTVVVAGGGFTGIETAAEMPHRLRKVLGADADVRVVIVERNDAIGPDLGPGPRPVIEQALAALGVSWELGSGVAAVDEDGVTLQNGVRIDAATVIWTAGARANRLTDQIPAERDGFGRLHVDDHLRVKGVADVYATGDVARAATDDEGNVAAMSCQHAMNLGRSAGNNVAAELIGEALLPYRQPKYVTCLDLGPWGAVYTEGWEREVKMAGADAKALKTQINTEWIYPPRADRVALFELADPTRIVVA